MQDSLVPGQVNCPEKIIIILDPSEEMGKTYFNAEETNLKPNYTWVKIALRKFLLTKSILNRKHQFGLALLQRDGLFWYQEFTSDIKIILDCLNDTEAVPEDTEDIKEISMDPVFKDISKHLESSPDVEQSLVPKFVLRAILFYGRSHCKLVLSEDSKELVDKLYSSRRFAFDVLYLRNPSEVESDQGIISCLLKSGVHESGYILEISESLAHLFEGVSKLLAHPLQRSLQGASYTLELGNVSQIDLNTQS